MNGHNMENKVRDTGGRPITAPWRFDAEGNLVIQAPTWSDYFRHNYAKKYGCKVTCDLCKREVVQSKLNRHQQSEICKRMRWHGVANEKGI